MVKTKGKEKQCQAQFWTNRLKINKLKVNWLLNRLRRARFTKPFPGLRK